MFAAVLGCTLIVLQFFNYRGYLKFNRSQLQQDLDDLGDAFKKELGIRKSALPSGREVDDFVSKNAYLFTGFIAGNLMGYSLA
ncbi:hypothetical protein AAVH_03873 [Aphelenchoides avenae]|nr:hypothetical protein AAVH_03873 [Aphelenchus avenae]